MKKVAHINGKKDVEETLNIEVRKKNRNVLKFFLYQGKLNINKLYHHNESKIKQTTVTKNECKYRQKY